MNQVPGPRIMAQKNLKNFKALKRRIIMTDELILKYQNKTKEYELSQAALKEAQSSLTSLQHFIQGLKEEVHTLHQANETMKEDYTKCLKENTQLRRDLEVDEMLNHQYQSQISALLEDEEQKKDIIIERNYLREERDKWEGLYLELKRECNRLKMTARKTVISDDEDSDGSDAIFPPPSPAKNPQRRHSISTSSQGSFDVDSDQETQWCGDDDPSPPLNTPSLSHSPSLPRSTPSLIEDSGSIPQLASGVAASEGVGVRDLFGDDMDSEDLGSCSSDSSSSCCSETMSLDDLGDLLMNTTESLTQSDEQVGDAVLHTESLTQSNEQVGDAVLHTESLTQSGEQIGDAALHTESLTQSNEQVGDAALHTESSTQSNEQVGDAVLHTDSLQKNQSDDDLQCGENPSNHNNLKDSMASGIGSLSCGSLQSPTSPHHSVPLQSAHLPTPASLQSAHLPTPPASLQSAHLPTPASLQSAHLPTPASLQSTHLHTPASLQSAHLPNPASLQSTHLHTPVSLQNTHPTVVLSPSACPSTRAPSPPSHLGLDGSSGSCIPESIAGDERDCSGSSFLADTVSSVGGGDGVKLNGSSFPEDTVSAGDGVKLDGSSFPVDTVNGVGGGDGGSLFPKDTVSAVGGRDGVKLDGSSFPEDTFSVVGGGDGIKLDGSSFPEDTFSVVGGGDGVKLDGSSFPEDTFSAVGGGDGVKLDGSSFPEDTFSVVGGGDGVKLDGSSFPEDTFSAVGGEDGVKLDGSLFPEDTVSAVGGGDGVKLDGSSFPEDTFSVVGGGDGVKLDGSSFPEDTFSAVGGGDGVKLDGSLFPEDTVSAVGGGDSVKLDGSSFPEDTFSAVGGGDGVKLDGSSFPEDTFSAVGGGDGVKLDGSLFPEDTVSAVGGRDGVKLDNSSFLDDTVSGVGGGNGAKQNSSSFPADTSNTLDDGLELTLPDDDISAICALSPLPPSPLSVPMDVPPISPSPPSPLVQSDSDMFPDDISPLSPLPPSPLSLADVVSLMSPSPPPLSPLPRSPRMSERSISPFPESPVNAHHGVERSSSVVSPFPDSPINAHHGVERSGVERSSSVVSPFPDSPINAHEGVERSSGVVSPFPESLIDAHHRVERSSSMVSPFPESPINAHHRVESIVSPFPESPVNAHHRVERSSSVVSPFPISRSPSVISPLPQSPSAISRVITPLPQSPNSAHQDMLSPPPSRKRKRSISRIGRKRKKRSNVNCVDAIKRSKVSSVDGIKRLKVSCIAAAFDTTERSRGNVMLPSHSSAFEATGVVGKCHVPARTNPVSSKASASSSPAPLSLPPPPSLPNPPPPSLPNPPPPSLPRPPPPSLPRPPPPSLPNPPPPSLPRPPPPSLPNPPPPSLPRPPPPSLPNPPPPSLPRPPHPALSCFPPIPSYRPHPLPADPKPHPLPFSGPPASNSKPHPLPVSSSSEPYPLPFSSSKPYPSLVSPHSEPHPLESSEPYSPPTLPFADESKPHPLLTSKPISSSSKPHPSLSKHKPRPLSFSLPEDDASDSGIQLPPSVDPTCYDSHTVDMSGLSDVTDEMATEDSGLECYNILSSGGGGTGLEDADSGDDMCMLTIIGGGDGYDNEEEEEEKEMTNRKNKSRRTDVATGQEEDRTPSSSPRLEVVTNLPCAVVVQERGCVGMDAAGIGYGGAPCTSDNNRSPDQHNNGHAVTDLSTPDLPKTSSRTTPTSFDKLMSAALVPRSPVPSSSSFLTPLVSDLSVAQRQLGTAMQCPLPLPAWLVTAMSVVQTELGHTKASGSFLVGRKKLNKNNPICRQASQKEQKYILTNLDRLASGHLHLHPVITMFSQPSNLSKSNILVTSIVKFLKEYYHPKIEHILSLCHSQYDNLRSNNGMIDPCDPNFPPALLRPECQIVALLASLCRMQESMGGLLGEMSACLYQALLQPSINFHNLMAMGRVFTALVRLQASPDRLLFFLGDLVKKLLPKELHVILGIASVWPRPLCRKKGVSLFKGSGMLDLKGLEAQMLSFTLETVVMYKYKNGGEEAGIGESFPRNLHTLCEWASGEHVNLLASSLIHLLNTSPNVYIDSTPMTNSPWQRPRPSIITYNIVCCLNVLSVCRGWTWINNYLIRQYLWPILQSWSKNCNGEGGEVVREAVVVCILRLIGFISPCGNQEDPSSSSLGQLQRVLTALLKESDSKKFSLPVQLAAVDSLLEMCPMSHPSSQLVVGVVKAWLDKQMCHPWGCVLYNEFNHRFQH